MDSLPKRPLAFLGLALVLASPNVLLAQADDEEEELEFEFDATPTATEAPITTARDAELEALQRELAALRARVEQLEVEEAEEEEAAPPAPAQASSFFGGAADSPTASARQPLAVSTRSRTFRASRGLKLSGYVQAQYERHDDSEDQLYPGGLPMNQDRFLVRRGRVRLRGNWEYFAAEIELDGSTTSGINASVRRANVSALLRSEDENAPPLVALTAGLTEMPFGIEMQLGQEELVFMERSTGSLALFPGPTDIGAVLNGGFGPLRYDLAVMNGTPIDDRAGTLLRERNAAMDFFGRLGVEVGIGEVFEFVAGISFLKGKGFSPGQEATENSLQWLDFNNDGVIQATSEIIAVPGRAAIPSRNFNRWGVNGDIAFAIHTKRTGSTRVYGELAMGSNLDRGMFVSDPILAGGNLRQVAGYAAILQDVTRYGIVGFRYDYYDPNADQLDTRLGRAVPASANIQTFSPVAGLRLPGRGRLLVQYDVVVDHLGRDAIGEPTDLRNNRLTVRLQGEF